MHGVYTPSLVTFFLFVFYWNQGNKVKTAFRFSFYIIFLFSPFFSQSNCVKASPLCVWVCVCVEKATKNYAKVFGLSLFLHEANGCECCEFSSCGLFGFVSFLRLFRGFRWGNYRAQVSGLEPKSVSVKFHMWFILFSEFVVQFFFWLIYWNLPEIFSVLKTIK